MYTVWVTLEVKPGDRNEFLHAIELNAEASVRDELGCYRFDVIELTSSPNGFGLYELYEDENAFEIGHKRSRHFLEYQDIAARVVVPESQLILTGTQTFTFHE